MADHGIIFSPAMVSALRQCRKTQTRRLSTSPLAKVQPGDRLWVRENYRLDVAYDETKARDVSPNAAVWFADGDKVGDGVPGKLRPSIFMPRWATRMTMLIDAVRIEPLRDIIEDDAIAEGAIEVVGHPYGKWQSYRHPNLAYPDPRGWYLELWDSLHTGEGQTWNDNPDVLVLTFHVEGRT